MGDTYQFSIKKFQAWAAAIGSLLVIAGTVFGAARLGVQEAVRSEIDRQIETPRSPLTRHIRAELEFHEHTVCEPKWETLNSKLSDMSISQARIETRLDLILERTSN